MTAWPPVDPATRVAVLADTIRLDVDYRDANSRCVGRDDLASMLADFQERWPGFRFELGTLLAYADRAGKLADARRGRRVCDGGV